MVDVYIGLGSNLANPVRQIRNALNVLAEVAQGDVLSASSLYRSPPMGPADQPDYVNAVALLNTELQPHNLLAALKDYERSCGRKSHRHWGEREIDLDILLYGERMLETDALTIPHPGILHRAFVLLPLLEIAPDLCLPDGRALKSAAVSGFSEAEIVRLDVG